MNHNLFIRSENNPILRPNKAHPWESQKVYNCGTVYKNNQYHLFYRAVGFDPNWHSSIGYAVSDDGINFKRFGKPLLSSESEFEKKGLEDPRATKIGNIYYMSYTAYDGNSARLFLVTSKDLKIWKRHGKMISNWDFEKAGGFIINWDPAQQTEIAKKEWCKAGGIFPELIDNKYWMIFGDRNLWLASSDDGVRWVPIWKPFVKPRKDCFDSAHVEMGPPPVRTDRGWLILYHGVDWEVVYRLGFLLLDLKDPTRILYRSEKSIFSPKELYELKSEIDLLPGTTKIDKNPKVIFCCGAASVGNDLRIYYGAGDSFICTAVAKLDKILDLCNF